MSNSSKTSSPSTRKTREPYAPATELIHVPFVLYEIEELAGEGKAAEILPLIRSVIKLTEASPGSIRNLPSPSPEVANA